MALITLSGALKSQVSGYPTQQQVKDQLETYQRVVNKVGGFPGGIKLAENGDLQIGGPANRYPPTGSLVKDPVTGEMVRFSRNDLTVKMLQEFANVYDYKLPKELIDGLKGLDQKFVFDLADSTISTWVNRGSAMMNVSMAQAGEYVGYGMKAIELGTMTFEAAASGGYISDKETMNIAMTAGAAAGGIIGSIIPGIGTAIGTMVGTAVGALVGAIVGAVTKPPFDKTIKRMEAEAQTALTRLKIECSLVEGELNDYIFKRVFELSTRWVNSEVAFGYRFPLRWFDSNPGLRFEGPAMQGQPYLEKLLNGGGSNLTPVQMMDGYPYPYGKMHCMVGSTSRQGRIEYSGQEFRAAGIEHKGYCNFYCPEKILGCLYPPPAMNEFHAYGAPRVIAAFHARGFDIPASLSCQTLQPVDVKGECQSIPHWGKRSKKGEAANAECETRTRVLIQESFDNLPALAGRSAENFEVTANIISSDITRTTALMQSKQSILLNRVELEKEGVVTDVSLRFAGARNQHLKNMNRIAVGGGAALLGLALWKGFR